MFCDMNELVINYKKGERFINLDVDPEDEIFFHTYEGHCSSCGENGNTATITAEKLFEVLSDKDGSVKHLADEMMQKRIDKLVAKLNTTAKKLKEEEAAHWSTRANLTALKETIKLIE